MNEKPINRFVANSYFCNTIGHAGDYTAPLFGKGEAAAPSTLP